MSESLQVWRENIAELRQWIVAHEIESMLLTIQPGPLRVFIHSDGRATAIGPNDNYDLTTEGGLKAIAERTVVADG